MKIDLTKLVSNIEPISPTINVRRTSITGPACDLPLAVIDNMLMQAANMVKHQKAELPMILFKCQDKDDDRETENPIPKKTQARVNAMKEVGRQAAQPTRQEIDD